MTEGNKRREAIDRFWKRFMESVHRRGAGEPRNRYTFIRAREYIRNNRDCRLPDHTPGRVVDYFKAIGRNNRLRDWQCRQAVYRLKTPSSCASTCPRQLTRVMRPRGMAVI